MKDFEKFLTIAIEKKNEYNNINCLKISPDDRIIVQELADRRLIENIRYIGMSAVGFDLTYQGLHYFDENM